MTLLSINELSLRPNERFFTKTLTLSLLTALALHLVLFFCFDIRTTILSVYAPQVSMITSADPRKSVEPSIIVHGPILCEPIYSTPKLPSHLTATMPEQSLPELPTSIPDYRLLASPFTTAYSPITLHISGDLAKSAILRNPAPTETLQANSTTQKSALFRVQVNKGEVFFLEKERGTGKEELDSQARALIANLRFASDALILDGLVEVRFTYDSD